jgi:hypothetical protein
MAYEAWPDVPSVILKAVPFSPAAEVPGAPPSRGGIWPIGEGHGRKKWLHKI